MKWKSAIFIIIFKEKGARLCMQTSLSPPLPLYVFAKKEAVCNRDHPVWLLLAPQNICNGFEPREAFARGQNQKSEVAFAIILAVVLNLPPQSSPTFLLPSKVFVKRVTPNFTTILPRLLSKSLQMLNESEASWDPQDAAAVISPCWLPSVWNLRFLWLWGWRNSHKCEDRL